MTNAELIAEARNAANYLDLVGSTECDPRDILRRLADALEAAEGGWQPIETAPKDGTWVLAYDADEYGETTETAHWVRNGMFGGAWEISDEMQIKPTLWMPLPAPPAKEGRG